MWQKIKCWLQDYFLCIFIISLIFGQCFWFKYQIKEKIIEKYDLLEKACNEKNIFIILRGNAYICVPCDQCKGDGKNDRT